MRCKYLKYFFCSNAFFVSLVMQSYILEKPITQFFRLFTVLEKQMELHLLSFFIHLRLHFNLLLIPSYLSGYFVSNGSFTDQFILQFLIIHVCLYGGANSLNSYYDKDDGPIGGMLLFFSSGNFQRVFVFIH